MELQLGKLKTNTMNPDTVAIKSLAHLGDAVYELFIRQKVIAKTSKINDVHKLTTQLVNASFHARLLDFLMPHLTEKEVTLIKRGRNTSLTSSKRKDQAAHRLSTALEALIGYMYLSDFQRLEEIFLLIDTFIVHDQKDSAKA